MTTPDLPSLIAEKLAALRSEAGLVTILDGIGEGFYAVDCDWRILLFNSEASRHFRCKPEDVIGRILWEVFPGTRDTGLAQLFHKVMASRESIRSETESIVHKGRWMAYRLFPVGDGLGVVFRDTTDHRVAEEQRAFEGRLITLSNVQAVLTQQSWDSAELHEVVRSALRAHGAPGEQHFTIEGPELQLSPQSAVALSMAVHELATNAIKYGALSAEAGHVDIGWSISDGRFRWSWRERGGPRVKTPKRKGFGSRMIERALALQLSG